MGLVNIRTSVFHPLPHASQISSTINWETSNKTSRGKTLFSFFLLKPLKFKPIPPKSSRFMSSESVTIEGSDGVKLSARVIRPRREIKDGNLAIVLVHPYSLMGGCQGLLWGIAAGLANAGYLAVTFDMRGVGRSTGSKSITGFAEVKDVISVCKWVCENLSVSKILLVGSSAGAPIAGSAVDQVEQVVGYVSIGYPFGLMASILFGRHHKAILQSPKPKLFIMGTRDGFTSVKQLKNKLRCAAGRIES